MRCVSCATVLNWSATSSDAPPPHNLVGRQGLLAQIWLWQALIKRSHPCTLFLPSCSIQPYNSLYEWNWPMNEGVDLSIIHHPSFKDHNCSSAAMNVAPGWKGQDVVPITAPWFFYPPPPPCTERFARGNGIRAERTKEYKGHLSLKACNVPCAVWWWLRFFFFFLFLIAHWIVAFKVLFFNHS